MSRINILFVALLLSLAGCATPTPVSDVTPTAAVTRTPAPSATPSPTHTATRAPTRTRTPTNTPTPHPTNTPLPPPTFTPATPLAEASRYRLVEWDEARANEVIGRMEAYPESLDIFQRGYHDYGVYRAFRYAALARQEALLWFPSTQLAESWRWGYAYNLVQSEGVTNDLYAEMAEQALNNSTAGPSQIKSWIESHEPRFAMRSNELSVRMIRLAPMPSHTESYLLELPLGACIWIDSAKSGFKAYTLFDFFDIANSMLGHCSLVDITNDGFDDVIAVFQHQPGSGGKDTIVQVFDLSGGSPRHLSFDPARTIKAISHWRRSTEVKIVGGTKGSALQITNLDYCPVSEQHIYEWNGSWLQRTGHQYEIADWPYGDFEDCHPFYFEAFASAELEPRAALIQAVLPNWPEEPFELPLDTRDELRYRLSLYQALVGDPSASISTLTDLIAAPTVITSTWVAPAQEFLEAYKTPDDLYRACAQAPLCEPRFAIEQLTRTLPRDSFALALDELRERGVPIAASGLFDFEGDGEAEHWFTIRHPGHTKTELWIVARTPEGMKAQRVSEISSTPSFVRLNTGDEARAMIQVKANGAESFFVFVRAPNTREPFVAVIETTSTPPETAATLIQTATDDLFAGADPVTVRAALLKARESHDFDCESVDCPQFEYLLGLTYELTGDERNAVQTYLDLWRSYPNSPFTIMARAKLELVP